MSETSQVAFVPLGPLYGWFCAVCGDARMGYPSKEESQQGASTHAMDAHAPEGGWENGFRELSVEWAEE